MGNNSGKILFSTDLEEFDIPEEYGQVLSLQSKLEVSLRGMESLEQLMEKHAVTSTIFSTALWAQHHPDYVRHLSDRHEIASHTYYHNHFETKDLANSRTVLSAITGKDIVGIRMPLMQHIDHEHVSAAGYLYDSSLHPTWLPGRYNHIKSNRTLHKKNNLWILPASVTPVARIPVFWLTFKNLPFHVYVRMCESILRKDGYIVFYFHPWEFTDLSKFKLPAMIKRNDGERLLSRLDKLFSYFGSRGYTFVSHQNFIQEMMTASATLI